ncbi:UNVERIFIED_CONTAM: hypothetical protein NCL1_23156 [Trichonephila clavipes]
MLNFFFLLLVMSIQQVPAEILEIIFANLDGTSFCRAKQVCKLWWAVVHKLQNSKKIWRKFCMQDISDGVIEELVSYKTIPYKNFNVDWLDIYKQWHFGKVIKPRHLLNVFEVQAFCSNPITCIATSGSWVVTGHNNGVAYVWSISDDDNIEQKSDLHLKAITDIALVDLLNLVEQFHRDSSLEAVDQRAPNNSKNWEWMREGDVSAQRSTPALHGGE